MRKFLNSVEPFVRWILLVIVVVIVLALLIQILGIRPPREFTIATGRKGGAYHTFAEQYAQRFSKEGYTLTIRETAGTIETLDLLTSGEVDVGFVQNSVFGDRADPSLSTLASLFYEAMWIFYRDGLPNPPQSIADLQGLRINGGEAGSANQTSTLAVLALNGITTATTDILTLSAPDAAEGLKNGTLDVSIMVSGAASPLVQELLKTPGINLLPVVNSQAYAARFKNVTAVTLPMGIIDFAGNVPPQDVPLIANRATLVANDRLHPDLARLLLIIATEVHSRGGIFEEDGEFPNSQYVEIPMNADAVRYLENGPTGLERYLPLWLASRLERLIFLLLPVALIAYPLLRGLPSIAAAFNEYRLKRRYQRLREIEKQYRGYSVEELDAVIADLEAYQREINERVNVPTGMLDALYDLRMHTGLTLDRLYAQRSKMEAQEAAAQ